jgi:hypothetical protein
MTAGIKHDGMVLPPLEILKRDPKNVAALLDIADRERYWQTRDYQPEKVKAIYDAYEVAAE